jgi:hypothetical protein
MLESVNEWTSVIVPLVGFPVAILALFLGWRQLRYAALAAHDAALAAQKAAETLRVQVLLALEERLSDFEDVRAQVMVAGPKIDKVRLRRYIAAFEGVGLALRRQEIDLATVDQFYGDRFAKLTKYPDAVSVVKGQREGWEDFYYLWEELRGYEGNKRRLSEPPG